MAIKVITGPKGSIRQGRCFFEMGVGGGVPR